MHSRGNDGLIFNSIQEQARFEKIESAFCRVTNRAMLPAEQRALLDRLRMTGHAREDSFAHLDQRDPFADRSPLPKDHDAKAGMLRKGAWRGNPQGIHPGQPTSGKPGTPRGQDIAQHDLEGAYMAVWNGYSEGKRKRLKKQMKIATK